MMAKAKSILVVSTQCEVDSALLTKAARVARSLARPLELFLCDAEQAYALKHSYEPNGFARKVVQACVARATDYLARHKDALGLADLPVQIDASCESPLYESILHKVRRSEPELVIKSVGGGRANHSACDANDWQLMRTCPSTLALVRGRRWREKLRMAAAIDVSDEETKGLAGTILELAKALALATGAELDVVYAERAAPDEASSQAHAQKLRQLARDAGIDDRNVHILAGHPERELSRFAAGRDYDVMVLGALTHRPSALTLVGTLTSVLVEDLHCDFVLVKPQSRPPEPTADSR